MVNKSNWLKNKAKTPNPNNKGVALAVENVHSLTREQFDRVLPKKFEGSLTPALMDQINEYLQDDDLKENLRENILGYTSVIKEGRYKLTDYLNAVRYVSYKLLGATNIEAYAKTFPDRYQRLIQNGSSNDKISSFSTAYNKNKLVNDIYGQTLIPTHILNAHVHQKAINHQAYLMMNARSEQVQQKAADSLMAHLAPPEATKIELEVTNSESEALTAMKATIRELATRDRKLIENSLVSTKDVAERPIHVINE